MKTLERYLELEYVDLESIKEGYNIEIDRGRKPQINVKKEERKLNTKNYY